MIANVFNTPRLCAVTGSIRPAPKLKTVKQNTKPTTAFHRHGIAIPQKEDADKRQTFRKASI